LVQPADVSVEKSSRRRAIIVAASFLVVAGLVAVVVHQSGAKELLFFGNASKSGYPSHVFLYDGPAVSKRVPISHVNDIVQYHHYRTKIIPFTSIAPAPLRSILWEPDNHVVMFPSLSEYPGFSDTAKVDMRAFVGRGNCMVFLGDYKLVDIMNSVFNFQMEGSYAPAPYYKNDRLTRGTPFNDLPARLQDVPGQSVVGVSLKSLPLSARSMFDSMGVSVAFYIPYDEGVVVYIGGTYNDWFETNSEWGRALHAAVRM